MPQRGSDDRNITVRPRVVTPIWASRVGVVVVAGLLVALLPLVAGGRGAVRAADPVTYSSLPLASWRVDGTGRAVLKVGNVVYVGGSFTTATSFDGTRSAPRSNLAAFDATTGELITTFRADTNGAVYDIQTDGTSLFIGGAFTLVGGASAAAGGVARTRLAAIDPVTGALRPGFRADANSTVYHLSRAGSTLYVGGAFTTIGGVARTRAAAVSTATGTVDPSFHPVIDGTVLGIAASPDGRRVYVGGPYATVNGVADADISTLDGRTGATVGPELTGVTGYVDNLEVTPDGARLIAGHSGVPGIGNRTAVYSTATGVRQWRQVVDGDVQGIRLVGGTVFAGFHDGANGDGATRLAGYDLASGTQDPTFHPVFDQFMGGWAITGDDSALVVAGGFSIVSGVRAQGFAIFPSAAPTPVVARVLGSQSWRYLDDGSNQGTAWRQPGFGDGSWKSGVGEFGYGDGGEPTEIATGPVADKYITTYFRMTFDASAVPASAGMYMRVDDGAVLYLNGVEVARDNMPAGALTFDTRAAPRDGGAETDSNYFAIDPALVRVGTNTLAVEVHQESPTSDDLTFFPSLVAFGPSTVPPPQPGTTTTTTSTTTTSTTVPPTTAPTVTTSTSTTVRPTTVPATSTSTSTTVRPTTVPATTTRPATTTAPTIAPTSPTSTGPGTGAPMVSSAPIEPLLPAVRLANEGAHSDVGAGLGTPSRTIGSTIRRRNAASASSANRAADEMFRRPGTDRPPPSRPPLPRLWQSISKRVGGSSATNSEPEVCGRRSANGAAVRLPQTSDRRGAVSPGTDGVAADTLADL